MNDASNAQLFLSRLRDHYVDQLLVFVADQRRNSLRGEAEVKIELEPGSPLFRSLAVADFVRNDNAPEIVEFEPERFLRFEPVAATLGDTKLNIDLLRWDDVVVHHDASFDAETVLGPWFDKWFDPDDRRYRAGADLGNVIHSLGIEHGKLVVDFGSAGPDAFWELLELLAKAGASELRVAGTPIPAES